MFQGVPGHLQEDGSDARGVPVSRGSPPRPEERPQLPRLPGVQPRRESPSAQWDPGLSNPQGCRAKPDLPLPSLEGRGMMRHDDINHHESL